MKNPLSNHEIEKIFSLAIKAGDIARDAFLTKNFLLSTKDDDSEITSTDIAISHFLSDSLANFFPKIPVISEEGEMSILDNCENFFLIDPIDGTASFSKGCDQFSVNIALISNKKAVFGLLYAPLFEGGKLIFNNAQNQVIRYNPRNNQRTIIGKNFNEKNSKNSEIFEQTPKRLNITTSIRSKELDVENFIAQFLPNYLSNYDLIRLSSAVKFIGIIENKHQLYLHFRRSMEWDTAAGQILVELSGGKMQNLAMKGNLLSLNDADLYQKPNFINSSFIATSCKFSKVF